MVRPTAPGNSLARCSGAVVLLAATCLVAPVPTHAQQGGTVAGRVTVIDRGDRDVRDVGEAVVWLESAHRHAVTPDTVQVVMSDKNFRPNVTVVPTGSVVSYPNADPFNHNVFSLSREGPFDLGLYGRGETKSTRLTRPGVIRVYCNVHARMSSFVVVRDNPHFAQPSGDGSFSIAGVPPGQYELVVWHERADEARRSIDVATGGLTDLEIELDVRGYERVQHKDKYGRPYTRRGRRY